MTARRTLQVSAAERRIIEDILRTLVPEFEVWAFGSRATGAARPYSDLDLAIVADDPLPIARLAVLTEAFSESDLPWKVDVVDWSTTSGEFRRVIRAEHVRLDTQRPPIRAGG